MEKIKFIDILINNAGSISDSKSLLDIETEDLNLSIDINFTMAFMLTKLCLPKMIQNNYGRIINISLIQFL